VTEERQQVEDRLATAQAVHGDDVEEAESKPAAKKPVRAEHIGRNDPCPCGSGKKYKNCCGKGK
ncbi:MAG: SEC-C domain-containing protein, partial [Schwartzia sp.]|nr:SEC-C domain-containing protein [Schwartzia sp. (in: firmicutes)]